MNYIWGLYGYDDPSVEYYQRKKTHGLGKYGYPTPIIIIQSGETKQPDDKAKVSKFFSKYYNRSLAWPQLNIWNLYVPLLINILGFYILIL